ncbi:nitrous oxide reductase accessory protein NosL [Sulfurimonas sp.]|uniref:nitrous oxide reductase accessory protein NosL n=1 Tax=Sulfurimonas sp. TaxID=2022749 RepID=UPI003D0DD5F0
MSFFKTFILLLFTTALFSHQNYSTALKEKKIYPMGKKIYEKKCQTIELEKYASYEKLQSDIQENALCGEISPQHLEALCLYLWEVKRSDAQHQHFEKFHISKDDKCPVCGMFVYKYPTWAAKIEYQDKAYFFDGIKDLLKYYFEHQEDIKNILVQDYYTQKILDAKKSYFVIGSDVYGPMGNELIAFETLDSAKKFMFDHKGKEILKFDEIDASKVYSLDD